MKPATRFVPVVLVLTLFDCLLFASVLGQEGQATTATIKKKNGQVVKGDVKGVVVQGESRQTINGSGTGYGGLYYTAKGEQIEGIDDEGVHYKAGTRLRYISIGQKDKIDDTEAVGVAIAMDEGGFTAMFEYSSKHGAAAVKSDFLEMKTPAKLKILGEYRKDGKESKIIPALEVSTAKGVISVPVEEIVEFKKAEEKPKQ